jgi:hypothetical protein
VRPQRPHKFISVAAARRKLDCTRHEMQVLITDGWFATRQMPRGRIRINLRDVNRLIRSAVRPARPPVQPEGAQPQT